MKSDPPAPALSVVVPTFNNEAVLRQNLDGWRRYAGDQPIEVIVVEDGCQDGTRSLLEEAAGTSWGQRHLLWIHQEDAHELRCTNAGLAIARGELIAAWQDDMFLRASWLVPEIVRLFERNPDLGLLALSRGLNMFPLDEPIAQWEDLLDWRRLRSTIGPFGRNWVAVQEVDAVIRPWVVRRTCLERVGLLDEAFVPTEWDEADLAFRIRKAGWRVGTHGYERDGAYEHLGSSTLGVLSDGYKARVLKNGLLFHARWDHDVRAAHARRRRTWWRPLTVAAGVHTAKAIGSRALRRLAAGGRA